MISSWSINLWYHNLERCTKYHAICVYIIVHQIWWPKWYHYYHIPYNMIWSLISYNNIIYDIIYPYDIVMFVISYTISYHNIPGGSVCASSAAALAHPQEQQRRTPRCESPWGLWDTRYSWKRVEGVHTTPDRPPASQNRSWHIGLHQFRVAGEGRKTRRKYHHEILLTIRYHIYHIIHDIIK